MKKLIAIGMVLLTLAFVLPVEQASAQREGVTVTLASDTLNGNETVNFTAFHITRAWDVVIQALCENIGGTSGGTLNIEGSIDNVSWETINDGDSWINGYPNDTLTILDNAVYQIMIRNCPWTYLRGTGTGTASDSTLVTWKYVIKQPSR